MKNSKLDNKTKQIDKHVKDTKASIQLQEETKAWIELKFKQVIEHLLLDFVSLDFHYVDGAPARNGDGNVIFTVSANDKYHQMNINVYPSAMDMMKQDKKQQLINGIVHECCHIHSDRLTKVAEDRFATRSQIHDANEHLTEVIAEYVRRLIKKNAPHIYNN